MAGHSQNRETGIHFLLTTTMQSHLPVFRQYVSPAPPCSVTTPTPARLALSDCFRTFRPGSVVHPLVHHTNRHNDDDTMSEQNINEGYLNHTFSGVVRSLPLSACVQPSPHSV